MTASLLRVIVYLLTCFRLLDVEDDVAFAVPAWRALEGVAWNLHAVLGLAPLQHARFLSHLDDERLRRGSVSEKTHQRMQQLQLTPLPKLEQAWPQTIVNRAIYTAFFHAVLNYRSYSGE